MGEVLDFRDDRIWNWETCEMPTIDLHACVEVEQLVGTLQVPSWSKHDGRCGTSHHVVGGCGFVAGFAVGTKQSLAMISLISTGTH